MILLYARVILQEKKNWAVQFTNCTALYDATLCQSQLQEKKGGRAVHAPPFQVQFSYILHLGPKYVYGETIDN